MQKTWKRPVMIGMNPELLDQAEELGIDVSEIAQRALERAIAAKSRRFSITNVTTQGPTRVIFQSSPHRSNS
jgi:post-segregation antitoxin (ccd killing protein)